MMYGIYEEEVLNTVGESDCEHVYSLFIPHSIQMHSTYNTTRHFMRRHEEKASGVRVASWARMSSWSPPPPHAPSHRMNPRADSWSRLGRGITRVGSAGGARMTIHGSCCGLFEVWEIYPG